MRGYHLSQNDLRATMATLKMFLNQCCFILLTLVACCGTFSLCCLPYQKQALLQFKSSLKFNTSSGANFEVFSSWNSSSDCCLWERVTCSSNSSTPQVTGLFLSSVIGSVSTDVLGPLFCLRSLQILDVSYNEMEGEIPGSGLANLTQLELLDMSSSARINGSVPPQLFYLRKLRILNLFGNSLSGEILKEIVNLTNLQKLDLGSNNLSGFIPPQLFYLRKLKSLYLPGNSLHGEIPSEIGNLTNLQELHLGSNNLSGCIPPQLFFLRELTDLSLAENSLRGEIPMETANLTNLQTLDLAHNNFSGEIPPSLRKLGELTGLYLQNNNLSSEIAWLFDLQSIDGLDLGLNNLRWGNMSMLPKGNSSLRYLHLESSNLEGEIPFWLFNMTLLQYLSLDSNKLRGSIPSRLFQATNLAVLDLSFNELSGKLPENICEASSLLWLSLAYNKFSGQVPHCFPSSIRVIQLSNNEFSGSLALHLTNLSNLIYLDLDSNNITGEIPQFSSRNRYLHFLNLGNNSLEGTIPDSLSNFENLQLLDLSNNKISGVIPESLGKLKLRMTDNVIYYSFFPDLEVFWKKFKHIIHNVSIYTFLDLSNNRLSGKIPDSLGALNSLKVLNVSHNKLSGRIPHTFGHLNDIESLDLSHNNLSGEIPESFGKLMQLTLLDLSNNRLTGKIPNGPQMDRMNDPNFYANNSGLCGMQISVPCEKAEPPKTMTKEDEEESKETWFSWVMVGIGYPFGFLTTVVVLYVTGYFNTAPQRPLRQHIRFRNF